MLIPSITILRIVDGVGAVVVLMVLVYLSYAPMYPAFIRVSIDLWWMDGEGMTLSLHSFVSSLAGVLGCVRALSWEWEDSGAIKTHSFVSH